MIAKSIQMACMGAPLFGKQKEAIGAFSISGPPERILTPGQMESLALALMGSVGVSTK